MNGRRQKSTIIVLFGIYGVFHMLFKEKTNKIVLIFALTGTIIMVLFIGMLLFVNS